MSKCVTGGQGCVFFKELKCVDGSQNHEDRTLYISKLQRDENTNYEYSIIAYLRRTIPKHVPDYHKYTILDDITKCVPIKTQVEIQKECPKCTIPYKNNSNVSTLNMPYKGISLDQILLSTTLIPDLWKATRYTSVSKIYSKALKYYTNSSFPTNSIKEHIDNPAVIEYIHIEYSFKTLNNRLIEMFSKLIQTINILGVYHSDIKASNILMDVSTTSPSKYEFHNANMHIIDWGITNLSTTSTINLNRPLCIPILQPSFMGYFNTYIKDSSIETIVFTYLSTNPITITGHVTILNEALSLLTGISSGYICGLHPKWFLHIVNCLKHMKTNGYGFEYIKTVVMNNKDVVGFISVYVTIYITLYYNYVRPTAKKYPNKITIEKHHDPIYRFYQNLGKICLRVLVETYTKIEPNDIITDLSDLNKWLLYPTK